MSGTAQATQTDDQTAPRNEGRNRAVHIATLSLIKLADGLIDPKLILSWLLTGLGSPAYLIGALVPVREAGALLPQLALARLIQARAIRKPVWAVGAATQGVAALAIAAATLSLTGAQAGWAVLAALACLAVARAACSASHKDILARTVKKGARGTVSGVAGSIGAAAVLAFAAALSSGVIPRDAPTIAGAIAIAGGLWLLAALIVTWLDEPAAPPAPVTTMARVLSPLKEDHEFRAYVTARALLIGTALAPPFLVMLTSTKGASTSNLGLMVLSSAIAKILSSYVWGRLSDRSSRQTLMAAGALAAGVYSVAACIAYFADDHVGAWTGAGFIFCAQLAYEGVRAGRKTHLTDMDAHGQRPAYTALANSLIGLMLLAGGGLGVVAEAYGPGAALILSAVLSLAGLIAASRLTEVQAREP